VMFLARSDFEFFGSSMWYSFSPIFVSPYYRQRRLAGIGSGRVREREKV
jgi:hypothetical protein